MHILQAITTKSFGPTNHSQARVSAKCSGQRIMLPWRHEWSHEKNHMRAAEELMIRMKWDRTHQLVGGGLPDDSGYCWVQISKEITL